MLNQRILEALRKIRDEGPKDRGAGICANVLVHTACVETPYSIHAVDYRLQAMFAEWPSFVTELHPVDGGREYTWGRYNGTLWNNPRRHELLHWLISYMENEVCPQ